MSDAKKARLLTPKAKRTIMLMVLLVAVGLLVFVEVIRPDQDAKSYTGRLTSKSQPLEKCFEKLTDTTQLKIYSAPDVALETKQADTATILNQITECRKELATFDASVHQLLTFHLAGYTKTYRDAKVSQQQAIDVIGQSKDVMDQYADLANFLSQYYQQINAFVSYTTAVGNATIVSNAQVQTLSGQANDLRARAKQISALKAPAGFEDVKPATSTMFTTAATGFDNLIKGFKFSNDSLTTTGYNQVDQALASYDSSVVNMPFDRLNSSYVPKQVLQLPAKIENLLAGSSE